jgi:hypothetical protein
MKNSRLSVHLQSAGPTYFSWPGESRPTGILLLHHGLCSCVRHWIGFLLLLQPTRDAIQRLWSCIVGGVVVDIVRHLASNHLISLGFRNVWWCVVSQC